MFCVPAGSIHCAKRLSVRWGIAVLPNSLRRAIKRRYRCMLVSVGLPSRSRSGAGSASMLQREPLPRLQRSTGCCIVLQGQAWNSLRGIRRAGHSRTPRSRLDWSKQWVLAFPSQPVSRVHWMRSALLSSLAIHPKQHLMFQAHDKAAIFLTSSWGTTKTSATKGKHGAPIVTQKEKALVEPVSAIADTLNFFHESSCFNSQSQPRTRPSHGTNEIRLA